MSLCIGKMPYLCDVHPKRVSPNFDARLESRSRLRWGFRGNVNAISGASSYTYAEATRDERLASWGGAHELGPVVTMRI
jgi:hypothetical protein